MNNGFAHIISWHLTMKKINLKIINILLILKNFQDNDIYIYIYIVNLHGESYCLDKTKISKLHFMVNGFRITVSHHFLTHGQKWDLKISLLEQKCKRNKPYFCNLE